MEQPRHHRIACNNDGVWSETGATLDFTLLPAFHQTHWFLVLCTAMMGGLVWAGYRWRLRQVAARLDMQFQERLAERTWVAQDLHDTFPDGGPGVGLLLLRATVGVSLMIQGGACLAGRDQKAWMWLAGLLVLVAGASLLIGCLTPAAGVLAAVDGVSLALSWLPPPLLDDFGSTPATVFLAVMAAAVVLLGPGALSLDARLFGRREIVIPRLPDR